MITLHPMTEDQYKDYLEKATEKYAQEKVFAGNWHPDQALIKAKEEYVRLLPHGEKTDKSYLYTIYENDRIIGVVWLAHKYENEGFIYDIHIHEDYQGRGFGKETMMQIEKKARHLGIKKIGLQVFGHNYIARALYEKVGYEVTNMKMVKEI
ncbi:GNAT family N-acetyltransferase [Bacillus suaedae]|uniref:GNAT family N-acetyltransferase n=1 Tax=Halalkalibacter suaedae TaxID=2822140 RepID=A0A941AR60_9BACI|nr:GNAT family N-acetyltransferase [Bacillus suaedae]MBP3953561.1 GNAT family N-acetyltransferase [Bacillus suaedae]